MRNAVVNELTKKALADDKIIVLTADLGYSVFEDFAKALPKQFYNVGISEGVMTSAAAGLALSGAKVITYSIANFNTLRTIEQIRNDICYHNAHVVTISVGGGLSYGQLGMSHHGTEDVGMMSLLPGMQVFTPADPEEALAVLQYCLAHDGPSYIRLARRGEPVLYTKASSFDITKIQKVNSADSKICLLCSGPILIEGFKAVKAVNEKGINIELYSVPCIKPIDKQRIIQLCKEKEFIFTLEEHQITGGLGSTVCEIAAELEVPKCRIKRLGLHNEYSSIVGNHDFLCEKYGLSSERVLNYIIEQTK